MVDTLDRRKRNEGADFLGPPETRGAAENPTTDPDPDPYGDGGASDVTFPSVGPGDEDGGGSGPGPGGGAVLPPTQTEVPEYDPTDYSDEAEPGAMSGPMDYEVPEAGDVPFVTDSGTGVDPTMTPWDVTDEQLVQGQLTDLYDRDSPFFELARQRAIRQHLSAGGQNSAMAAGFGELAAMDTAFKVAFADAQTYARSAEFNAAMKNQFSLAEQRFIHNALLSDQNYRQARELQTQRIAGQLEQIVLDYKGRSNLMDQELDHWFLKVKQQHEYNLDMLYEQASLAEGQAGRDFARTMVLNGMTAMTNFYMNAFSSVLQYANNPNFTPEQQAAAMREGMAWASSQFDLLQAYWGQWAAGGPPSGSSWMGQSPTDVTSNWWSFPYNPYTGEPNPNYAGG